MKQARLHRPRKLKDGDIIEARKEGQTIFYSLRNQHLKILRPFFKIINQQNSATQTV
jgi:DNA-binding transcriptional ArsR family regulator